MKITRQKYNVNTIHTITQLDIWDSRLLASTDFNSRLDADKSKEVLYPVNIHKYAELCGNVDKNTSLQYSKAFDKAVDSAMKLKKQILEIQMEDNLYYTTSIIHSYIEERDYGLLAINFDSLFLPLVTGTMEAGQFYMPVVEMHSLSSPYKIAMYHLLEKELWRLKEAPYFTIPIADIRETLKLRDKYPRTNSLVNTFIKPTLAELAKITRYNLDYKVVKETIQFSAKAAIIEI